ncbi:MAG: DUF937 domain-containing protein, partial [Acidobacteriota bacterium]|nr:DUF937 domain-containing protein [Acidobacteriota bacterium]
MIIQQLEGPLVTQISQRLGVDPQKATQLVAIAIPILISVLTHQKGNLGTNQTSVTQGISEAAGISPQQAQQLVSIVAPALKGKLGEHPEGTVQQAASEHTKQIAP